MRLLYMLYYAVTLLGNTYVLARKDTHIFSYIYGFRIYIANVNVFNILHGKKRGGDLLVHHVTCTKSSLPWFSYLLPQKLG